MKSYFAINQDAKKTLKDISEELGLTKERVRQLRENGIKVVQTKILAGELNLSSDFSLNQL